MLSTYANAKTAECWSSVPTSVKKTGLSEKTVRRALKELCEKQMLEQRKTTMSGAKKLSNVYHLSSLERFTISCSRASPLSSCRT